MEIILQALSSAPEYLKLIGPADVVDMAIIAFVIYHLFRWSWGSSLC